MILEAVYLNAIICSNELRNDCQPPQFMWAAPADLAQATRAFKCAANAELMNQVQADKAVLYRCDAVKGVES